MTASLITQPCTDVRLIVTLTQIWILGMLLITKFVPIIVK